MLGLTRMIEPTNTDRIRYTDQLFHSHIRGSVNPIAHRYVEYELPARAIRGTSPHAA